MSENDNGKEPVCERPGCGIKLSACNPPKKSDTWPKIAKRKGIKLCNVHYKEHKQNQDNIMKRLEEEKIKDFAKKYNNSAISKYQTEQRLLEALRMEPTRDSKSGYKKFPEMSWTLEPVKMQALEELKDNRVAYQNLKEKILRSVNNTIKNTNRWCEAQKIPEMIVDQPGYEDPDGTRARRQHLMSYAPTFDARQDRYDKKITIENAKKENEKRIYKEVQEQLTKEEELRKKHERESQQEKAGTENNE